MQLTKLAGAMSRVHIVTPLSFREKKNFCDVNNKQEKTI